MRSLDDLAATFALKEQGRDTTIETKRLQFEAAQVPAQIAMFDGDAILAQAVNGWLIRIEIPDDQAFALAMALLERVR